MAIFEDDFIIIDPDPTLEYESSIVLQITSKDLTKNIFAGADPNIEKADYVGIGSLKLPLSETSYVYINIFGVNTYSFKTIINNMSISEIKNIVTITENGLQIKNQSITNNNPLQPITSISKIDTNKFLRK